MALVGMILAGMAFFAAGGVAWRRGYAQAPVAPWHGPAPAPSPERAPTPSSSGVLPVRAPSGSWDIASLIARASERDEADRNRR